jgi:hypothetical protein
MEAEPDPGELPGDAAAEDRPPVEVMDGLDAPAEAEIPEEPPPPGPMDDQLRLQHLQWEGTHNSYHVATPGGLPQWDYTHAPLEVQLERQGVRQVELDIHWDPDRSAFTVYHIPYADPGTTCATLRECLQAIRRWSDTHRGHGPIFVLVEPKDDVDDVPITGHLQDLDREVQAMFPASRLLRPDDVRGDRSSLREALQAVGGPTLRESRGRVAFVLLVAAAAMTSFYSWRLIFKTFHGEPHDRKHWKDAHESPLVMLIPLGFLALGSFVAGFPFKEIFAGHGVAHFFRGSLTFAQGNTALDDLHHVPLTIALLPTVMMAVGFAIAWVFYIKRPDIPVELARQHQPLYQFLLNKWYFDELYEVIFVRPAKWLGRALWKGGDGWLIDGFGPDGVSARVLDVTRNVVRLQTGYLYHYAFAMLIGAALLITWFMFSVH